MNLQARYDLKMARRGLKAARPGASRPIGRHNTFGQIGSMLCRSSPRVQAEKKRTGAQRLERLLPITCQSRRLLGRGGSALLSLRRWRREASSPPPVLPNQPGWIAEPPCSGLRAEVDYSQCLLPSRLRIEFDVEASPRPPPLVGPECGALSAPARRASGRCGREHREPEGAAYLPPF